MSLKASTNKPQKTNANHGRIRQSVYTTHSQFSVFSRVFKLFNPTPVARRHVYLASAVTAPPCPPLPRNYKGSLKKVNLFTRPSAAVRKVGFTKPVGSKTVQYFKKREQIFIPRAGYNTTTIRQRPPISALGQTNTKLRVIWGNRSSGKVYLVYTAVKTWSLRGIWALLSSIMRLPVSW